MPTIQILAIVLGVIAASIVFHRSWDPEAWWFDNIETLLKAGFAFICVAGAIWLVNLVDWDRRPGDQQPVVAIIPATATVPPAPSPPPPPSPSATVTVMAPTPTQIEVQPTLETAIFIDMGDCAESPRAAAGACSGELGVSFEGWGSAHGPWNGMPFTSPFGDTTLRDMQLGRDNLIHVSHLAQADYTLTAEVADGACDDSFRIIVDGAVLYEYWSTNSTGQSFGPHRVHIPASAIVDGTLSINFQNTSRDGCGLAGVFNVALESD